MDKLAQDVTKALATGMSYGKWKAMQPIVKIEAKVDDGMTACPYCGERFKPRCGAKYCSPYCQRYDWERRTGYKQKEQSAKDEGKVIGND